MSIWLEAPRGAKPTVFDVRVCRRQVSAIGAALLLSACANPVAGMTQGLGPPHSQPSNSAVDQPAPLTKRGTFTVSGTLIAAGVGGFGMEHVGPNSDVVRYPDGSCTGWARPGTGRSTAALTTGAGLAVMDPETGAVIGAGELRQGTWTDSNATHISGHWLCVFPYTAHITGSPTSFVVQVADFPPWYAVPDPTHHGAFTTLVDVSDRSVTVAAYPRTAVPNRKRVGNGNPAVRVRLPLTTSAV